MGDIDQIMSRDLEYGIYDNLLPQSKNKDSKTLKMENKLKDNAFYTQEELLKMIGA